MVLMVRIKKQTALTSAGIDPDCQTSIYNARRELIGVPQSALRT
jgi:hypothetical protein